jgi:hypothetical protein
MLCLILQGGKGVSTPAPNTDKRCVYVCVWCTLCSPYSVRRLQAISQVLKWGVAVTLGNWVVGRDPQQHRAISLYSVQFTFFINARKICKL